MWKRTFVTAWIFFSVCTGAGAQGYMDQEAVAPILEMQGYGGESAEPVGWHRFNFSKSDRTTLAAMKHLQSHLDSLPGGMLGRRLEIVELSNRVRSRYMIQRRELLIPDRFENDFLAYSPYPSTYAQATTLPKLFIIDKYTQTFAAYESGKLVRWGLVSTGREDDLTPSGRYNFNWKQEYRESSEAPEGEVWKLRWVFNFHETRGLHVHQYQLPLALPASHGCVRLSETDAAWNFNWANQRTGTKGTNEQGTPVIVINHIPVGLPAHWTSGTDDSVVSLVSLPDDPMTLPLGTESRAVAGP